MITQPGKEIAWGEMHVGARQVFEEAGFLNNGSNFTHCSSVKSCRVCMNSVYPVPPFKIVRTRPCQPEGGGRRVVPSRIGWKSAKVAQTSTCGTKYIRPDQRAEFRQSLTSTRARQLDEPTSRLVRRIYWRVGRLILDRQQDQGRGSRVIYRSAADLRRELPDTRGWSRSNLFAMRSFANSLAAGGNRPTGCWTIAVGARDHESPPEAPDPGQSIKTSARYPPAHPRARPPTSHQTVGPLTTSGPAAQRQVPHPAATWPIVVLRWKLRAGQGGRRAWTQTPPSWRFGSFDDGYAGIRRPVGRLRERRHAGAADHHRAIREEDGR